MNREAAALLARFRQGLALHRQGDLAAAERVYQEVLDRQPRHFDSLHMLGMIALQTRRTERGIELVRRAIAVNDKVAAAHNNLGKALLDLKRPEQALPSFDKAIALASAFAEAHANRGNALVNLGRSEQALASYQEAVALKPDFAEAHRNCGNVFSRLKRYDEAFAAYDKAFALRPDSTGVEGQPLCQDASWRLEQSGRRERASDCIGQE
jgi:protein O-GlcNAc transferase